jgi:ABC-2 type transport system ATP-binding protein
MLSTEQLSFTYRKGKPVLENVNLNLTPGNVYGLLGLNGVGKTTLLQLIAGCLFPKGGSIQLMGFDPKERDVNMLANLYYVPVEINVPNCSIARYLSLYQPFYPNFDLNIFKKALDCFGLEQSMQLNQISFGQKKKVVLAFALATQCKVLLLDEPTDGLDSPSKAQFRRLLSEFISEERIILIATHHINDIASLVDQIILLENTKLLLNASVEAINTQFSQQFSSKLPTEHSEVLYSERLPQGYQYLTHNTKRVSGNIDMEFFFNAVSLNPAIAQSFNPKNLMI